MNDESRAEGHLKLSNENQVWPDNVSGRFGNRTVRHGRAEQETTHDDHQIIRSLS